MKVKAKKKQFTATALAFLLAVALAVPSALFCAPAAMAAVTPAPTNCRDRQNYTRWATPVTAYLYENENGGLTRVEYVNSKIYVETYNSSFQIQSSQTIPMELSVWGGFYAGETYNFFIFGQNNPSKSDSTEVFRVVKYSKDWKRLGQTSISNSNTTIPFNAGSLRCAERNGILYVRTCREMYSGHQANITFSIHQGNMALLQNNYTNASSIGYVSHSFNQFAMVDSAGRLVTVDHGDAYPRSIVLVRYDNPSTNLKASSTVDLFVLPGSIGANTTNAAVGGLAETSSGYVTAYHYGNPYRDVYLSFTNKNTMQTTNTKVSSAQSTCTPVLVPTGQSGGYIFWNCSNTGSALYCADYSANGSVGSVRNVGDATLSSCQPIVYNGDIVWFSGYTSPTFYSFDGSTVTPHYAYSDNTSSSGNGSSSDPGTTTPVPTKYTVSFSPNGASGTTPSATVNSQNEVVLPSASSLTKSGYTFAGWKSSYSNNIFPSGATIRLSGNTVFTAQWVMANRYAATFSANGASGTVPTASVSSANLVVVPSASSLTKTGYTFAGWKRSDTGAIVSPGSVITLTQNTTFTAQWTPAATYTATFNPNGASGTMPTATVSSLNRVQLPSANSLTKSGYTFTGWKSNANSTTYSAGTTVTLTKNTVFTAQWSAQPAAAVLPVDTKSVTMKPGDTYTFLVKGNNDTSRISRQIDNSSILSVSLANANDPRGALYKIQAKSEGTATINLNYQGKTASIKVNITKSAATTTTNPGKGSIMLDTANYIMAPGNIYDIGVTIKNPSGRTLSGSEVQALYRAGKLKVRDSRTGSIANLTQLSNGNFRVTGKNPGTCYIVYDIGGNHASVKVDVQNGVKQHGTAVRNTSYFTQNVF